MGGLVHGDLPLLHRLEERGLRPRCRAVDLVDEDDVRGEGTGQIFEASGALVVHRDPGDIARHQVRRALDAAEREVERARDRAREHGLPHPRDIVEQDVAINEQRREELLRGGALADDDLLDLLHEAVRGLADGDGHPETMRPRASARRLARAAGARGSRLPSRARRRGSRARRARGARARRGPAREARTGRTSARGKG